MPKQWKVRVDSAKDGRTYDYIIGTEIWRHPKNLFVLLAFKNHKESFRPSELLEV